MSGLSRQGRVERPRGPSGASAASAPSAAHFLSAAATGAAATTAASVLSNPAVLSAAAASPVRIPQSASVADGDRVCRGDHGSGLGSLLDSANREGERQLSSYRHGGKS